MLKQMTGFTLIELVVFIVVMGIVALAVIVPLTTALGLKSPTANYQTTAIELAAERMDAIIGQRRLKTYPPTDPCPGPAFCTAPTGYTVTPTITTPFTISGDNAYSQVVVAVTGLGTATLAAVVGNY
jgi:type II secretory pathway pseudopilin PulG